MLPKSLMSSGRLFWSLVLISSLVNSLGSFKLNNIDMALTYLSTRDDLENWCLLKKSSQAIIGHHCIDLRWIISDFTSAFSSSPSTVLSSYPLIYVDPLNCLPLNPIISILFLNFTVSLFSSSYSDSSTSGWLENYLSWIMHLWDLVIIAYSPRFSSPLSNIYIFTVNIIIVW